MKNRLKLISLMCLLSLFACKNQQKKTTDSTPEKTSVTTKESDTEVLTTDAGEQITLISPEEAEKLMQLEGTQLVDVRTREEVETRKIDGSVNMIYEKNFKEKIANLDKTKPVIVYCRSGRRSAICAEVLKEAGFEKIYDLDGGITKWVEVGKSVVKEE